jgi:biotin transport system substrate-specific component
VRPDAATLRLAVLPRSGLVADAVLVTAGAVLVALAAQLEIHLGFTPVPITGQTFAVLLVGASLGAVRGTTSLGLYFLAGLLGAPVYSGGEEGWEIVSGVTGGYLIGFIVASAVTGWLAEARWDRRFSSSLGAMLIGSVIIYAFGLPWLAHVADLGWRQTFENGLYPFVVGDLAKLWLAAALLPAAWRVVERLTGRRP